MKVAVLLISVLFIASAKRTGLSILTGVIDQIVSVGCERDVASEFKRNYHRFCVNIFKTAASHYQGNFAISPYSVWLSFAAIAEGLTGAAQDELLEVLNLPNEECLRLKYYDIATTLETSGDDVKFERKRYLVTGDGVKLNTSWATEVRAAGLLDTASSAFDAFPEETKTLLRLLISPKVVSKLGSLSGKSLILDSLNYSALWSSAFTEESIQRDAPFHNDAGEKIGTVDMFRFKKKVKLAFLPLLDLRVLEVPVGAGDRYRMLMMLKISNHPISDSISLISSTFITDILSIMQKSLIPLEVAIPRFSTSAHISDVKEIMEELGVKKLWSEGNLTQYVTEPSALPSAYVQRVDLSMDSPHIEPQSQHTFDPLKGVREIATGVATMFGKDFIANKPFFYILLDSETKSCHFMGVYSIPSQS